MNQPTTPNTVEDFLPLPKPAWESVDDFNRTPSRNYFSAAQMHAYVLADRAQRPTVAGSVDTREFREMMNVYRTGSSLHADKRFAEIVAHINARFAPAAPSEGVVYQFRQRLTGTWIECDATTQKEMESGPAYSAFEFRTLYTHPAPSEIEAAVELPNHPEPEMAWTKAERHAIASHIKAVLKDRASMKGNK